MYEFFKNEKGDAIVEATILFPIMIMIIAGITILSIYLPTKGVLQHATKKAGNAVAVEYSDTWVEFDKGEFGFKEKSNLGTEHVYKALFNSIDVAKAEEIVKITYEKSITPKLGELKVEAKVKNYVIYKEVIVMTQKTIPSPVNLSFVGFPKEIIIDVQSIHVVQNGDELVRNIDIARDVVLFLDEKYKISEMLSSVTGFLSNAAKQEG